MNNSPALLKSFIRLARPNNWVKNLLILAPLFFGLKLTDRVLLIRSLLVIVLFSLAASAVYVFNDIKDAESDRRHPAKQNRPVAAGDISQGKAAAFMIVLAFVSVGGSFFLLPAAAMWICIYLLLNIAYSAGLKHVAILDVFMIALGFLLRLAAGSAATGIPLSMWILLITFVMALFIGLAKRRDDLILAENGVSGTRSSIDGYNLDFVNHGMTVMAAVLIVAYIMYTVSPEITRHFHSRYLYLTVIFVILGILRYMQRAFVEKDTGSPVDIFFHDHFIQLAVLGWLLTFWTLLYR
ncbi:MAG: decaprenyl-phosphate phosphoribosyltransferase [Acidobacteria bacterium]|nr:decaprenyl-phosphate phosphoribosyltransferase [Acidobacteriota bacterium]